MGKNYSIYTNADPGPAIVELTAGLIEDIKSIDDVYFVAYSDKVPKDAIGVFYPLRKEVYIDLGHVLQNTDMYNYGCLYIPGLFYTTLWAIFHECAHGKQVDEDDTLLKLHKIPDDYEQAAQAEAHTCLKVWVESSKLPPIEEWGWLGEKVIHLVNSRYIKGDVTWLNEVDLMKKGACANAEVVCDKWKYIDPPNMFKAILDGSLGMKIDNNYYLTAIDFFGLDDPKEKTANAALTVRMN